MASDVFGFEGNYAKVKNDLIINSKEFLYQMKYVAENSESIPSDYFEQYYKKHKTKRPTNIRCSRNRKNREFTKIIIY